MKNETIVDRVVERLKTQPLGDLITEEDLHDIVKQAIPKTFFENRKLQTGSGFNTRVEDTQPLIVEVMAGLLKDSAQKAVDRWLTDNSEIVADHWKQVIDVGLLKYVQSIQDAKATASVRTALQPLLDGINRDRANAGLPPIYF